MKINSQIMTSAANYVLSVYSFIKTYPLEKLLDVGNQSKEGNPIPSFDEDVLIELCSEVKLLFEHEKSILELDGDFIIVGDIHGSLHDLLRILNYIEKVNYKVIFLGDYVDRGEFSLECITILFALKATSPDRYFLLRGNHEFDSVCSQYGFKNEILDYHNPKKAKETFSSIFNDKPIKPEELTFNFEKESTPKKDDKNAPDKYDEYYANHIDMNCYKYSEKLYEAFVHTFSYLPICAIINNTTFCIHGGLSPHLESLDYIRDSIQRPTDSFEGNALLSDVIWSDPSTNNACQFCDNPRGRGCLFNADAVANFLNINSLERLIRAHQCVKHGSSTHFNKKCITVFSASSYSPEMANSSGILKLLQDVDAVRFVTFPPLDRLKKSDATYYKVEAFRSQNEETKNGKEKILVCFSLRHPKLTATMAMRSLSSCKQDKSNKFLTPQRFSKPVFVTSTRKTQPFIKKPLMYHSVSMENMSDDGVGSNMERSKLTSIFETKSLYSFNKMPKLDNDV